MTRGIISAPQPEAVDAGADMLDLGGNAVDAAIACALVQGVVDPLMCGIAGFGSLQLYLPSKGVHKFIDFHGKAPSAVRPDMWEDLIEGETRDGFGFILKDRVNDVGYQSITVPGSLKAYFEAHSAHGALDWETIVGPAIDYAENGFMVRPHVAYWWSLTDQLGRVDNVERLRHTEAGRNIYLVNDEPRQAGAMMNNPDLGRTLRRIAKGGADVFYKGEIAEEIAADMKANGALLSYDDLTAYQTKHLDPVWGNYRDHRISTNNPPGGGVMLLEMLNILEEFDLAGMGHNSAEYIRIVSEVMKRATSDKDAMIGDPDFFDVPVEKLISKAHAQSHADAIKAGDIHHVTRVVRAEESKDTTQVSVLDEHGNAVSMTHSLGMPSGVISPNLGFMFNGCMGVFDPRPGHADSLAPGKSRFSAVCPSLVFKGDDLHLVIGAPGGTLITLGVLQAILNVIDFDMSIVEAVFAPRFAATSDVIDVTNRISRRETRKLEKQGYEIIRSYMGFGVAAVHGIKIENGKWTGAADPGHDGMAVSV